MKKEWEKLESLEWEYLMTKKLKLDKEEIEKARKRYMYQEKKIKGLNEKK